MLKKWNVLIIDDHPLIIRCHKNALEQIEKNHPKLSFKIRTAGDCDTANFEIENAVNGIPFDLVLLDIRLPHSKCNTLLSGEDIGLKIKELFSKVRIIVFTSYTDNYRISNILHNLNPEGFLIKEDISFQDLVDAITNVIFDPPFYSKAIMKLFRNQISNEFILDNIDRQLLYHLSIGSMTKDLPKVIPLSLAGIEKRKRKLKDLFDADHNEDKLLIEKAREKGFI